ncbi:MAG: hypothetical protein Q9170_005449 [Blastenia crenularia]
MSDVSEAVERLATPPSTPASTKPTLSSQTSTGKSKYKRKFDKSLLATPSSKASPSPPTTTGSSFNEVIPAGTESSTPSKLPQPTLLQYQTQAQVTEQVGIHVTSYSQLPAPQLPPPPPMHQPYISASMSYSQSYLPGHLTYHASTAYQINPSPPSANNSPYDGEAHHRQPLGINPSPPVVIRSAYGSHIIAPSEPTIAELPAQPAAAPLEDQPGDDKNKQDTKQKSRQSFKRFFREKKLRFA